MKLTLTSILAAFIASIGLGGCAGVSKQDQNTLAGAGIGGGAGAILTDGSAAGTLGGAAVGGIIGRLITPNDDGRGNDYYNGNGADNGPRYSSRSRQSNGFGYGGYNSGDRYHSTSNEWLGN
jgi:osmotically inducible lipoprotein OsmB